MPGLSTSRPLQRLLAGCLLAGCLLATVTSALPPAPVHAQMMHGGPYLDAKYCGEPLGLNPGSTWDGGKCEQFKFIPQADGWARIVMREKGTFLGARDCTDEVRLGDRSDASGGACQLWRLRPDSTDKDWSRLEVKQSGRVLDATSPNNQVHLAAHLEGTGEECQLWRAIPVGDGWVRLQIKAPGLCTTPPDAPNGPVPWRENADEEFVWMNLYYGWYASGWNGPGYYVVGTEQTQGTGYGGPEGWHGWTHHTPHHPTPRPPIGVPHRPPVGVRRPPQPAPQTDGQ